MTLDDGHIANILVRLYRHQTKAFLHLWICDSARSVRSDVVNMSGFYIAADLSTLTRETSGVCVLTLEHDE